MAPRVRLVFEKTKGNAAALQRSALIFIQAFLAFLRLGKLHHCRGFYRAAGIFRVGFQANVRELPEPTSESDTWTANILQSHRCHRVSINADKDTIFDMIEGSRVDFVYSAPYILGCLESEFEIQPLATVRKRYVIGGKEYILNR